MTANLPSSLDSAALARRLGELVGDERSIQVEFLLHLDEFDRRRAYLEAGFGSLWDYCLRSLHLREGAAGRRIGAMRVLRRFPKLEAPLRDARLCVSTAPLLGQVLTHDNLDVLVERAAYRTKAEVEHLVASIRPRPAPAEGIRKLPAPASAVEAPAPTVVLAAVVTEGIEMPRSALPNATPALAFSAAVASTASSPPAPPGRAEVRPVSEEQWSMRVTLDSAAKEELETLRALLSHKIPDGDLNAVLREAIRCGIEKHGNRKGASAPAQQRSPVQPQKNPNDALARSYVPAAVRRAVWKRDGGRCTFAGPDGHRCNSRWQLELDHIAPVVLGGASTVENLRLRCRPHNMLHAEQVYGREHMEHFRRGGADTGGGSAGDDGLLRDPVARESVASYGTSATPPASVDELLLGIVRGAERSASSPGRRLFARYAGQDRCRLAGADARSRARPTRPPRPS